MFDTSNAECSKYDPAWWEPQHGRVRDEVARICAACPLNDPCLAWATSNNEFGIWAGLTREQRIQLRRGKQRAKCPICKAGSVWNGEDDQICAFCGISWNVRRKTAEPVR